MRWVAGLESWRGGRVPLLVKGNQVAGSQTSSDEQGIDNHEEEEDDHEDEEEEDDDDEDDDDGEDDGEGDDDGGYIFTLVSKEWTNLGVI